MRPKWAGGKPRPKTASAADSGIGVLEDAGDLVDLGVLDGDDVDQDGGRAGTTGRSRHWSTMLGRSGPRPIRHPKRNRWLDRLGWYEIAEVGVLTSTRQAEALNTALVSNDRGLMGPVMGTDVETGQPITLSPHELYLASPRRTSSPNVVILGAVGKAKSSLAKTTYLVRPLALGVQCAVFDRKRQGEQGEYRKTAEAAHGNSALIRFSRSGGAVVNVLDPRISVSSTDDEENGRVGQDELLLMVARHAHGDLDSRAHYALRAAHGAALRRAREEGQVATLHDVVDALFKPDAAAIPRKHLEEERIVTTRELTEWGLDLAVDLERFVDGDLSGLIDGVTAAADGSDLDLSADLLVIDTSALGEDSPALSLVMAIMTTYLSSVWSASRGRRIILIEEGYHTVRLPGVAAVFRSLAKRGRGIGLSVVTVFHHISDVPDQSDAMSLIREAGIVHVYAQDKEDDALAAIRLFGLPGNLVETLSALEAGTHVLKIGSETPRLVAHDRTELEEWITATDEGMTGVAEEDEAPFQHVVEDVAAEAAARSGQHVAGLATS